MAGRHSKDHDHEEWNTAAVLLVCTVCTLCITTHIHTPQAQTGEAAFQSRNSLSAPVLRNHPSVTRVVASVYIHNVREAVREQDSRRMEILLRLNWKRST